jgi:hypothetical protein
MKLWLVEDRARWGFSINVVRAATEEEAIRKVLPHFDPAKSRRPEITPLEVEGGEGVVWCYDHSPDTPRDD